MGEVSCYYMQLYCDDMNHHPKYVSMWEYTGINRAECVKEAKEDGWKFKHADEETICPKCNKK